MNTGLRTTIHWASLLLGACVACGADRPIGVPPAPPAPGDQSGSPQQSAPGQPQPTPNGANPTVPGFPFNPVPGGAAPPATPGGDTGPGTQPLSPAPSATAPQPGQPPALPSVPPPAPGPTTPCPQPPVNCPPGVVYVLEWPYYWNNGGVGIFWGNQTRYAWRLGYPNETLQQTARRLDPQLLPPAPPTPVVTPAMRLVLTLRAHNYEQAATAIAVLMSQLPSDTPPGPDAAPGATPGATPGAAPPGSAPAPVTAQSPQNPPAFTWTRAELQRLMAVALIGQKRGPESVRAMIDAYSSDPSLVKRPLDAELLSGKAELSRLVVRAVGFAQKSGKADAWFTAGVLMQAQGRPLPRKVADMLKSHEPGKALIGVMGVAKQ